MTLVGPPRKPNPNDIQIIEGFDLQNLNVVPASPPSQEPILIGQTLARGIASGVPCASLQDAMRLKHEGKEFIFCARETSPRDMPAIVHASGLITEIAGAASHAAVVARGLGIPAISGIDLASLPMFPKHGSVLVEVDGNNGRVAAKPNSHRAMNQDGRDGLLKMCSSARRVLELTGGPKVSAAVDSIAGWRRARELSADGIGLFRTEYAALMEVNLWDSLGRCLTARPARRDVDEFENASAAMFSNLFDELGPGERCVVRLLDMPSHEHEAMSIREVNPMLGFRGMRLGLVWTHIYGAQMRALCAAMQARDNRPEVVVLLPMVAVAEEVVQFRKLFDDIWPADLMINAPSLQSMLETPASVLDAQRILQHCEGASFGIGDLTQLLLGLSRDDGDMLLSAYHAEGLLDDPFRVINPVVGRFLQTALGEIRSTHGASDREVSICGAWSGDHARMLREFPIDSVSVPPESIPVFLYEFAKRALDSSKVSVD